MTELLLRTEDQRRRALDLIAGLNLDRGGWVVSWKPHRKRRSLDQNALYHKIIGAIADQTGHSHDEIHEWAKAEFLPPRSVEIDGRRHEYRTTTKLDTAEMSRLIDKLYAFGASELGLILPHPSEMHLREVA